MALNEERLVAVLEARIDEYERKLRRASAVGDQQFKKIETRGKQMERQLALSGARGAEGLTSGLKTLAALTAGGAAVDGLVRLSDAATRVDNALKTAGLSGEELERIYQSLYASALKNSAPLEDLTTLYSRAAQAQKELGASSAELTRFTDNVALALRVSGKSATESAGALQQLGQLLGGARVQAEEFNSIQDGAPAILQAVAAGLKEAGGSVSRLKALVNDGKVSNQTFSARSKRAR
ncbi:tape measure protein [Rhizobium sp. G21]|uniref:tape measure protein n=1 Tax=Rhizobium sp. G21 TaxID=2758439 RepID=UPI0016013817|nr:tape measure protein [Rhizobium sp. G21]MBB1247459.1 tape measure protein [Rhizobium sp. G21]